LLADYRLLELGGGMVKWGPPVLGEGATVTYALVTRPVVFRGARNCGDLLPVDELLIDSRIGRSEFEAEVTGAFDAWSSAANVRFVRNDESTADILIGAQAVPTGRAFTNVEHASPTAAGAARGIVASVICLNPEKGWKIGFDGNLDTYDIRYTLMHEIGHAIGLDHPGVTGALMDFRYQEAFSSLQEGDRAGAVSLYGPRQMDSVDAGALVPADPVADRATTAGMRTDSVERALGAIVAPD
jgi:hypothetical protein